MYVSSSLFFLYGCGKVFVVMWMAAFSVTLWWTQKFVLWTLSLRHLCQCIFSWRICIGVLLCAFFCVVRLNWPSEDSLPCGAVAWRTWKGNVLAAKQAFESATKKRHRAPVKSLLSIEFSADAEKVLAATDDGTAKIWCVKTTQVLVTLSAHKVVSCGFDPTSQRVVTAGDKTARISLTNSSPRCGAPTTDRCALKDSLV